MAPKGGVAWNLVVGDISNNLSIYQAKQKWDELHVENDSDSDDQYADEAPNIRMKLNTAGPNEAVNSTVLQQMAVLEQRMKKTEAENATLKALLKTDEKMSDDDAESQKTKRQKRKEKKARKKLKNQQQHQPMEPSIPAAPTFSIQQLSALHDHAERMTKLAAFEKEKAIKDQWTIMGMHNQS